MFAFSNATIYILGGFGATKTEVKSITAEEKTGGIKTSYVLTFVERGKRKEQKKQYSETPFVIVKGFGHPNQELYDVKPSDTPGIIIKKSKYVSFDERWKTDFESFISKRVNEDGIEVLVKNWIEIAKAADVQVVEVEVDAMDALPIEWTEGIAVVEIRFSDSCKPKSVAGLLKKNGELDAFDEWPATVAEVYSESGQLVGYGSVIGGFSLPESDTGKAIAENFA